MQWCNFSGVKEKRFWPVFCQLSHRLAEAKQSSANADILTISLPYCVFIGWHKSSRHADLHAKTGIFKQLGIIAWIFRCFEGREVAMPSILCIFPEKVSIGECVKRSRRIICNCKTKFQKYFQSLFLWKTFFQTSPLLIVPWWILGLVLPSPCF